MLLQHQVPWQRHMLLRCGKVPGSGTAGGSGRRPGGVHGPTRRPRHLIRFAFGRKTETRILCNCAHTISAYVPYGDTTLGGTYVDTRQGQAMNTELACGYTSLTNAIIGVFSTVSEVRRAATRNAPAVTAQAARATCPGPVSEASTSRHRPARGRSSSVRGRPPVAACTRQETACRPAVPAALVVGDRGIRPRRPAPILNKQPARVAVLFMPRTSRQANIVARAISKNGDSREAVRCALRAVELGEGDARSLHTLALAQEADGRLDDALATITRAASADAGYAEERERIQAKVVAPRPE